LEKNEEKLAKNDIFDMFKLLVKALLEFAKTHIVYYKLRENASNRRKS